jgi:TupA-like ATPgrasp
MTKNRKGKPKGVNLTPPAWKVALKKKDQENTVVLIRQHLKVHGEFLNIFNPVTFTEKVLHGISSTGAPCCRRLPTRPPCAPMWICGSARKYCRSSTILPAAPTPFHSTTFPTGLLSSQRTAPAGCNWSRIRPPSNYYKETREWTYKYIDPRIIVEEFIDDGSGTAPNDYKLFVFGGTVEMIQVDVGRFTDYRRRLYTPTWKKLDVLLDYDDIDGDVPRPVHLAEMIAAAETLGQDWDFIRADFYDTGKRLYFGELTMTPKNGATAFAQLSMTAI